MTLCALLLLAALCCFAAHARASDDVEFVTSPTGVRLPSSAVRAVLPPSSHDRPHDHVYDVVDDGDNFVVGPRKFQVDLAATPDHASVLALHPAVRARLNGVAAQTPPLFNATLRRHGPYHFVHGGARGRLLALWGPGLHLLPLDHARYPTTLLNTLREDGDSGTTVVNPDLPYSGGDDSVDGVPGAPRFKTPAVASDTKADCATGAIHYAELVAAFDNTFCALFGNDASAALAVIQAATDIAGEPYQATCVRLVLVGVDGHCNDAKDPFTTRGRGATIVDNLRSVYAQDGRRDVRRDIVVLFTGFGSTDSIGTAYVPGVCNRLGYAWIEKVNPFTLAHELGHNLGMFHIDDSDPDRPTGIMGPSGQSRKRWFFLPESIANLTRFVDHQVPGYDVSCLSTQSPVCDTDDCPAGCKDNKCVVNTAPGPGRISCAPASLYDCADSIDIVDLPGFIYNVKVDCPVQYDYVEAVYDANDPTLVCCLPADATKSVMAVSTLYTYINPPVSRPDGSIYEKVINLADNYTLGSVTFLDTQMVPCTGKLPGSGPTPTPSPSVSVAPSTSASVPKIASPSPSVSAPIEPSASTSSPPASKSVSASPSFPSSSLPPSPLHSASTSVLLASPSESASSSTMLSPEPSASAYVSVSPTETASVSVSLPASPLGSTSVPPSASVSAWNSESPSQSASASPILSVSASLSLTPSSLGSAPPSAEPSASAAMSDVPLPSASASPSATTIILEQVDEPPSSPSSSASPSVSSSVTTSSWVSAAVSQAPSWSMSPWETVTPSVSVSWSIFAVPSVSMLPSTSAIPSEPIVLVPRELNAPSLPTPSASYSTSASVSLMPTSSVSTSQFPAISSSVSWSVSPSFSTTISSAPSSSTTPSTSPSPSTTVIPSSSQTPAPTESTSATSTPTPSSSGAIPTSCGDTFSMDKHLACRKSADVTLMSESIKTVRLKIFIRFGQFYYKLKGLNGHKLEGFGLIVSTSSRLRFWRVRRTITRFALTKTVSGFYGTPIYDIPLTKWRRTCCGPNSLYSYVGVRVCNKDGEDCTRLESQISMKMACRPVCAKDASLFASSPMNTFKRCPSCEDV